MSEKIPTEALLKDAYQQILRLSKQNLDLINEIDKLTCISTDDLLKFKKDQEISKLNSEILSLRQTNNKLKRDNQSLIIRLNKK